MNWKRAILCLLSLLLTVAVFSQNPPWLITKDYAIWNGENPNTQVIIHTPSVRLSNKEVEQKINQLFSVDSLLGESLEHLQSKTYDGPNITETNIQVSYSHKGLLSLSYFYEAMAAYPSQSLNYFLIDTTTANRYLLSDLIKPEMLPSFKVMVDDILQRKISEQVIYLSVNDTASLDWVKDDLTKAHFNDADVTWFTLSEDDLTIIYPFDFPHAIRALEPDGVIRLSHSNLKPYYREKYSKFLCH